MAVAVSAAAIAHAESPVVYQSDVTGSQIHGRLELYGRTVATTQPAVVKRYSDLLRKDGAVIVPQTTPSAPRGMSDYLRIPDSAVLKNEGTNTWHYVIPLGGDRAVVAPPQR
jgi:hypothetical protein